MTATAEEPVLRYVEGYGLRPHATGLDVVGGKRTARLKVRDPEKQALTLRIIELLRTGHSPEEAAERLRIPTETVRARLAPLFRLNVLTYAEAPTGPPQMARFLERSFGTETATDALRRLAAATVHLDGDAEACRFMADLLRRSGVGTALVGAPIDGDAPALVIRCLLSSGSSPCGEDAADLPTLYVSLAEDRALIGPLCDVRGGQCRHCVKVPEPSAPTGEADRTSVQVGLAIAVGEAVRMLSGTGYCRTTGGVLRVSGRGKEQSFETLSRDPRCVRCGLPGIADDSIPAYRSFQAADVPLKANWSYPLTPLEPSLHTDSTIKLVPWPEQETLAPDGPGLAGALKLIGEVFAAAHGRPRNRVPSVGGTGLLNVFVCGMSGDNAFVYYLDRRHGSIRALPPDGLVRHSLASGDRLTVIVAATLSRAESVFGPKANLTIYQDTGYATSVLQTALTEAGYSPIRRSASGELPDEVMRTLSLDPGRDVVTAVIDVAAEPNPRTGPPGRRRRARTSVRRADLDMVLAAVTCEDVDAFVRCHRVEDLEPGLYQVIRRSEGTDMRRAAGPCCAIDAALDERGTAPAALIMFTTDIGRALTRQGSTGIRTCVIDQTQSAQQVQHAARRSGLEATLFSDLPSTALAPDGRAWRTGHRSFAAVALAPRNAVTDDGQAVRW